MFIIENIYFTHAFNLGFSFFKKHLGENILAGFNRIIFGISKFKNLQLSSFLNQ
jgi:hypothetical protein